MSSLQPTGFLGRVSFHGDISFKGKYTYYFRPTVLHIIFVSHNVCVIYAQFVCHVIMVVSLL